MQKPRRALPLGPLLAAFRAGRRPGSAALPPPAAAVASARTTWLTEAFLDTASPGQFADQLVGFYRAVSPVPWHEPTVAARAAVVRHGLGHLLRGRDPLADRFARCAGPGGAYHVPGVGPRFWAAAAKALDPDRLPLLGPAVAAGLARVGLLPAGGDRDPGARWDAAARAYAGVLAAHPDLLATDLDDFFAAAAGMTGRDLGPPADPAADLPAAVTRAVREVRAKVPVRRRAAEFAGRVAEAKAGFEAAVRAGDWPEAARVVWQSAGGAGDPPAAGEFGDRGPAVLAALARVKTPADLFAADGLPDETDLWFAAGVLHLRQPARFPAPADGLRAGLAALDDAADPALPPADRYRLLCETAAVLRDRFRVHPAELGPVLDSVAADRPAGPAGRDAGPRFGGFCGDTFRFLQELGCHNQTGWMAAERDRYRFAVREPMVELCEALAGRYVGPVLGGEYGWDLDTDPRPGRALSSITKTDFGRGGPYVPALSLAFGRRRPGPRRDDVQFFVRVGPDGVGYGVRLGRRARDAGRRFRRAVQEHGDLLYQAVKATGAADACRFGGAEVGPAAGGAVRSAADLREWAAGKELAASRWLPPDAGVLRGDDLVGEVLILWDRLVPLFAAAVDDDPVPVLRRRAGATEAGGPGFDRAAFRAATHLSDVWLTRALDLLRLKKQLILQGVPGTGKTHVARCLARHLAGGRPDQVRLVQFHPGYSYEEFVEGLRPQAVEGAGQAGVGYPVTPGLLAGFAARAEAHPADPHVLVVDEINRGNLPRVFGELLFLLEYRDQEVTLPYSKKPFKLPPNLLLVGTMNPADRSAGVLDQALRRRFSFVDMPPDAAVLARWLGDHPPADPDPRFGPRVVRWFEDVNRRLLRDLGPDRQVGHSLLMVPGLSADTLRAVWEHHVKPALDDLFPGRPDRVRAYDPARLVDPAAKRPGKPTAAD